MKIILRSILVFLTASAALAQLPNNASLNGAYRFVHLVATVSAGGNATNVRTMGGTITFNGNGGFSFQARLGSGSGGLVPASGNGNYAVSSNAFATITNPIDSARQINARLGVNSEIVLGSSTEAGGPIIDFFVAVRGPAVPNLGNNTLSGIYNGAMLGFTNGSSAGARTAMLRLNANGFGSFPTASATGHAFATGDITQQQNITNAIYTVNSDGTGTAGFGSSSTLFSGGHDIFISANGNYLIGLATVAGNRQIFVATKEFSTSTNDSSFQGSYWIVELIADVGLPEYTTATGALRGDGAGNVSLSERTRTNEIVFDLGGLNQYALNSNGTGFFGPFFDPDVTNFAVGVPGGASPGAFVGAQIAGLGDASVIHGIYFGIQFPSLTGAGTFLNPLGILNSASFAPPTFPISGGTIVSLFGSGLASGTQAAQSTPLPTSILGTSVTVNGAAAPLFFVSPGQINLQVPFATSGASANIIVNRGGSNSNTVPVPVAPSSPGVFTQNVTGIGPGIITHADFSLVTPQSPAVPGETVIMFLTGLGALNPPVADGAPGPSDPLSRTTDPNILISFGGESGTILFSGAAPFFVGLYQVNVTIPNVVTVGPAIPVAIITGTALSDFIDIAIEL